MENDREFHRCELVRQFVRVLPVHVPESELHQEILARQFAVLPETPLTMFDEQERQLFEGDGFCLFLLVGLLLGDFSSIPVMASRDSVRAEIDPFPVDVGVSPAAGFVRQ